MSDQTSFRFQMAAVPPLMYVNSNGYGASTLIASGGQPASSYVGAALVPNVMLRQAVPTVSSGAGKLEFSTNVRLGEPLQEYLFAAAYENSVFAE